MNAISQPETFQIADASTVSAPRRNPGSVPEMLAILADMMNRERPLTDEELAAKYPEDDADEYGKWLDRDPAYLTRIED